MSEHAEHEVNYVKIWLILLALLVVSILGPFLGIKVVTLITAFGIAIVKAYLVAKNFMHLNIEPRYVVYLLLTMLVFMLLLFAGVAPDVMKHEGTNWVKPAVHVEPQAPAHH
jgi:caa(3)-type oxidase subunit IV